MSARAAVAQATLRRAQQNGGFSGHDGLSQTFGLTNAGLLVYGVTIRPRRRRRDGSIGRQADVPVHFTGTTAEGVLVEAAEWVRRALPEVCS